MSDNLRVEIGLNFIARFYANALNRAVHLASLMLRDDRTELETFQMSGLSRWSWQNLSIGSSWFIDEQTRRWLFSLTRDTLAWLLLVKSRSSLLFKVRQHFKLSIFETMFDVQSIFQSIFFIILLCFHWSCFVFCIWSCFSCSEVIDKCPSFTKWTSLALLRNLEKKCHLHVSSQIILHRTPVEN